MYEIDFEHPCRVHFIGIGGISMSGFAELLHSMGFRTGARARLPGTWRASAYKYYMDKNPKILPKI